MALFRAVACGCIFVSVRGLSVATHIAGDPQPPQYPVVNVHVLEPLGNTASVGKDALTRQQRIDILHALEAQLASTEQVVGNAVRLISSKIDLVANHLEAM